MDKSWLIIGAFIGGSFVAQDACNSHYNNRHVRTASYEQISGSTGFASHQDCITYADRKKECYVLDWRDRTTRYVDEDGDGKTDRIIRHGNRSNAHRLESVLTRQQDYSRNEAAFTEGDNILGGKR